MSEKPFRPMLAATVAGRSARSAASCRPSTPPTEGNAMTELDHWALLSAAPPLATPIAVASSILFVELHAGRY